MSKAGSEEQIQDEIRKRVFEAEEKKQQQLGADASREALSEMTSLSQTEVDAIAQNVRRELAREKKVSGKLMRNALIGAAALLVILVFTLVSTYNGLVKVDEQVKTKWSQVENVYQRRYDLIPNLVNTVKAYTEHEKEIFQMLTDARSQAGNMLNISDAALRDPAMFQQFQQAQNALSSSVGRLMAMVEDTPELKSDQNFLALQAQLEGSENRIAVERKRFNEAVQEYNSSLKRFPQVMVAGLFGFQEREYFKMQPEAVNAPAVNFK